MAQRIRIKTPEAAKPIVSPGFKLPFRGNWFTVEENTEWMAGTVDDGVVSLWKPMLDIEFIEDVPEPTEEKVTRRRKKE